MRVRGRCHSINVASLPLMLLPSILPNTTAAAVALAYTLLLPYTFTGANARYSLLLCCCCTADVAAENIHYNCFLPWNPLPPLPPPLIIQFSDIFPSVPPTNGLSRHTYILVSSSRNSLVYQYHRGGLHGGEGGATDSSPASYFSCRSLSQLLLTCPILGQTASTGRNQCRNRIPGLPLPLPFFCTPHPTRRLCEEV